MKKIMSRAHEIAKTLEGDYAARMSMALRQAWKESKKTDVVKFIASYGYGSSYVAKINGTHPKWKLNREFLNADVKERSYSGKTGSNVFYITENGVYEKAVGKDKKYFVIKDGEVTEIDYGTVLSIVS